MERFPWRTRAKLLAIVNAVAGVAVALGGVAVALGVTDTVDAWTSVVGVVVAAAVGFVDWLASIGIVKDGETQTTPVDDPLGQDGLPLLPFRKLEDLQDAAAADDIDAVRAVLGQVAPH